MDVTESQVLFDLMRIKIKNTYGTCRLILYNFIYILFKCYYKDEEYKMVESKGCLNHYSESKMHPSTETY